MTASRGQVAARRVADESAAIAAPSSGPIQYTTSCEDKPESGANVARVHCARSVASTSGCRSEGEAVPNPASAARWRHRVP